MACYALVLEKKGVNHDGSRLFFLILGAKSNPYPGRQANKYVKMKRLLIICAVITGLAACNKTEKESEGEKAASTDVEQMPAEPIHVDAKYFTATFPAGWEVREQDDSLVDLKIPDPKNPARWALKGVFRLEALSGHPWTLKNIVSQQLKGDEGASENVDDVTANGITWKVVVTHGIDNPITLYASLPVPGIAKVYMENLTLDQPEVKDILESITLKTPPPPPAQEKDTL